ncbi:UNVERIFIED_CONTAM: hypothetical protein HDU68_012521 [Siphonaria sp. JEL0065]|nr:hypothetical protein HDU68_012521 [Siphonaria sp. JEL0065]
MFGKSRLKMLPLSQMNTIASTSYADGIGLSKAQPNNNIIALYDLNKLPLCCQGSLRSGKKVDLGTHVLEAHSGICPICNVKLSTTGKDRVSNLASHVLESNNHCLTECRHLCNFTDCDMSFPTRRRLNKHTKIHEEVKVCKSRMDGGVCGESFTSTSKLLLHKKNSHSGKRPCEHCGKKYSLIGQLSRHISKEHPDALPLILPETPSALSLTYFQPVSPMFVDTPATIATPTLGNGYWSPEVQVLLQQQLQEQYLTLSMFDFCSLPQDNAQNAPADYSSLMNGGFMMPDFQAGMENSHM